LGTTRPVREKDFSAQKHITFIRKFPTKQTKTTRDRKGKNTKKGVNSPAPTGPKKDGGDKPSTTGERQAKNVKAGKTAYKLFPLESSLGVVAI